MFDEQRKLDATSQKNGVIQQKSTPISPSNYPISSVSHAAKAKGKGTALKGNSPIQKRKRPPYPFALQHPAKTSLYRAASLRSTQIVRPILQQRPPLIQHPCLFVRRPPPFAFPVRTL